MTWWRLCRDRAGSSTLEFALLAIPFTTLLVGFFEVAIMGFLAAALEGAALEASRFGTTGSQPSGQTRTEQVRGIISERTLGLLKSEGLEIETLVYDSFANIGEPEPFTDENGNGQYDNGEDYSDINGNGQWDDDMGAVGLGGPDSIVVYHVTYDWSAITPLMRPMIGTVTLSTTVPVRNEPF
jgi:Flp pilus assembly protein TadG